MNKEVGEWWKQAQEDLDTAQYLYNGNKFEEAAFFCQQAIEKGFKAIMLTRGKNIPKIHDLVTLGEEVDFPIEFKEACQELNIIYISTRYPGVADIKDIKNKAARYLNTAKKVLQWIKEEIS